VGQLGLPAVVAAAAHGDAALGAALQEVDPYAPASAAAGAEQVLVADAVAGLFAVVLGSARGHEVRAEAGGQHERFQIKRQDAKENNRKVISNTEQRNSKFYPVVDKSSNKAISNRQGR